MKTIRLIIALGLVTMAGYAADQELDGLPDGFGGGALGALIESRPGTLTVTRLLEVPAGDGKMLYKVIGTFTPTGGAETDKLTGEVLIFGRQIEKPKSFFDDLKIVVGAKVPAVQKSFESRMVTARGLVPGNKPLTFIYYQNRDR